WVLSAPKHLREMPKRSCKPGRLICFYRLKIKFLVFSERSLNLLQTSSNGFETVSKLFEKRLPFFLFLWQGSAKFVLCFVQWLQRCVERQFPDSILIANFRFCLQTEHWQ